MLKCYYAPEKSTLKQIILFKITMSSFEGIYFQQQFCKPVCRPIQPTFFVHSDSFYNMSAGRLCWGWIMELNLVVTWSNGPSSKCLFYLCNLNSPNLLHPIMDSFSLYMYLVGCCLHSCMWILLCAK